jgi:parvulin-like peptidyl-prolyl isomerase
VNGEAISWEALRPAMVEAAGAVALEEAALDTILEGELAARGVRWSDLDTEAERAILVAQLAEASPSRSAVRGESAADRGERLLAQLRAARGLGNARFEGALRRNAALRLLVDDQVVVNESVLRQAYDLRYGERIAARIIVVDSIDDATQVSDRLDAGEPFAEVAARFSTDESASRGGLLDPVSASDPSYPQALRDALRQLDPGQHSTPLALDNGIAIVLRERSPAPTAPPVDFEAARPDLMREARRRQERILMGELARELLENARVTIFDASLDRAWRARSGSDQ